MMCQPFLSSLAFMILFLGGSVFALDREEMTFYAMKTKKAQVAIQMARIQNASDQVLCYRIGHAVAQAIHLGRLNDIDAGEQIYDLIQDILIKSQQLPGYCGDQWESSDRDLLEPGNSEGLKTLNVELVNKTQQLWSILRE